MSVNPRAYQCLLTRGSFLREEESSTSAQSLPLEERKVVPLRRVLLSTLLVYMPPPYPALVHPPPSSQVRTPAVRHCRTARQEASSTAARVHGMTGLTPKSRSLGLPLSNRQ